MATTATTASELLIAIDSTIRSKTTPNSITPETHSDLLYNIVKVLSGNTFTGNTSGDCISDIYVSNVHSCSPLYIHADGQLMGSFTQSNGFTLETGVNMVIPTGSKIVNSTGESIVSEDSSNLRKSGPYGVGLVTSEFNFTNKSEFNETISGSSSGDTGTTIFNRQYNFDVGAQVYSSSFNAASSSIGEDWDIGGNIVSKYITDGTTNIGEDWDIGGNIVSKILDTGTVSIGEDWDIGGNIVSRKRRSINPSYPTTELIVYPLTSPIYSRTFSGTSTATTATTVFETTLNIDNGIREVGYSTGLIDYRVGGGIDGCCVRATDDPEYCGPCDGPKLYSNYRYDAGLNGTGSLFAEKYDFINGDRKSVVRWGDAEGSDLDCDFHNEVSRYSKTGLTRTDTFSGYSSGSTGTTIFQRQYNYDIGQHVASYNNGSNNYKISFGPRWCVDENGNEVPCPSNNFSTYRYDANNINGGVFVENYDFENNTIELSSGPRWCVDAKGNEVPCPTNNSLISKYEFNHTGLTRTNTINATYTGTTGTTQFKKSYDLINGVKSNRINWVDGNGDEQTNCDFHHQASRVSESGLIFETQLIGTNINVVDSLMFSEKYDFASGIYNKKLKSPCPCENGGWCDCPDELINNSFGYKTTNNDWNDFVVSSTTNDWIATVSGLCSEYPICNGSNITTTSILKDGTTDISSNNIYGINPDGYFFNIKSKSTSSSVYSNQVNVNNGADSYRFGDESDYITKINRFDIPENEFRYSISGVSNTLSGETVFQNIFNIENNTLQTVVNYSVALELNNTYFESNKTIKSNNGVYNLGTMSGGIIPSSPTDTKGNVGDIVSDGNNIYVKRPDGMWGITSLSIGW